ncbi:MAG TPA: hypothetical protein VMF32_25430 [Xanthobacteraceae bacterium]|nr:hypothetical protein [Xanthobacteraceae bacterium]
MAGLSPRHFDNALAISLKTRPPYKPPCSEEESPAVQIDDNPIFRSVTGAQVDEDDDADIAWFEQHPLRFFHRRPASHYERICLTEMLSASLDGPVWTLIHMLAPRLPIVAFFQCVKGASAPQDTDEALGAEWSRLCHDDPGFEETAGHLATWILGAIDRDWFRANPHRTFRLRRLTYNEARQTNPRLLSEKSWVLLRQAKPGYRVRAILDLKNAPCDYDDEEVLAELWEEATMSPGVGPHLVEEYNKIMRGEYDDK